MPEELTKEEEAELTLEKRQEEAEQADRAEQEEHCNNEEYND